MEQLKEEARELLAEMVAIRRRIHAHPELAFEERETARLVAEVLRGQGWQVREGVGGTGVVARMKGREGGIRVALRADMDALPVGEQTGLPFASEAPGRMHACGHDLHVAGLLGAAALLARRIPERTGEVMLLFQPAEEAPPGGALAMLADGIFDDPPRYIFGLHTHPGFPVGTVALREGATMAAADHFRVVIRGRGGHGSAPHQGVDAVTVAAQAVVALQQVVSREVDPLQPAVVTIGTIHGGDRFNILAERVEMEGTVRTLDPALREELPDRMERILSGVTAAFGATYEFRYEKGYPVLMNDPAATHLLREGLAALWGEETVRFMPAPSLGAEDFAYFLQRVSGSYFFLGVTPEGETGHPWHSARYNPDEQALVVGAASLAQAALWALQS